jgi:hypothetical protein
MEKAVKPDKKSSFDSRTVVQGRSLGEIKQEHSAKANLSPPTLADYLNITSLY